MIMRLRMAARSRRWLLALGALFTLASVGVRALSLLQPPLMRVTVLYIPDHREGADPQVIFDREVRERFRARWTAAVYEQGGDSPVCVPGTGRSTYEPGELFSSATLSWFLGGPCALSPGDYYIRAVWTADDGSEIVKSSNLFTVTPRYSLSGGF